MPDDVQRCDLFDNPDYDKWSEIWKQKRGAYSLHESNNRNNNNIRKIDKPNSVGFPVFIKM